MTVNIIQDVVFALWEKAKLERKDRFATDILILPTQLDLQSYFSSELFFSFLPCYCGWISCQAMTSSMTLPFSSYLGWNIMLILEDEDRNLK